MSAQSADMKCAAGEKEKEREGELKGTVQVRDLSHSMCRKITWKLDLYLLYGDF